MDIVSTVVMLMSSFNPALTTRTADSMAMLLRGAVLSPGAHTFTDCLRAAWPWVRKRWQTYGTVLRRAKFSMTSLARMLFGLILRVIPEDEPIYLSVDESLVRRWGPYVPAVDMHRDPVRSSRGRKVPSPGHKWVILSVVIRLSYMRCPVALPMLCALNTPPTVPERNRRGPTYRRHRTVSQLALLRLRILVRWAPWRCSILTGDGAYATHMLARKLRPGSPHRTLRRFSLVCRFYFDAAI